MHVGLVTIQGKKMSKSLGNFLTTDAFLKTYGPNVLRMVALINHYRSPLDFTDEVAQSVKTSLSSIETFLVKTFFIEEKKIRPSVSLNTGPMTENFKERFDRAMEDDLNTPSAIAAIFEFMNEVYPMIWNLKPDEMATIRKPILYALDILGIRFSDSKTPRKVRELLEKRELSRSNKQFIESDALRKEISGLGYKVEDTPLGPLVIRE